MSHFSVAVFTRDDDNVESLLEPFNECIQPGSEYSEFIEDDDCEYDETAGKHGYWTNPEAKWDWYEIGGRWQGSLTLKDGTTSDTAAVEDCVFKRDKKAYRKALRFWEVYVEHSPLNDGESMNDFDAWYKPEYYIEQYKNKETYADYVSMFMTYAFLTPEGEWFETGQMGWFGMDDATAESRSDYKTAFRNYLEKAKSENMTITIVDCHI